MDRLTQGLVFPSTQPNKIKFASPDNVPDPMDSDPVSQSVSSWGPSLTEGLLFPSLPTQNKDYIAGRPAAFGPHASLGYTPMDRPRPVPTPDRETILKEMMSDPAVRSGVDIADLTDSTLASTWRWAREIKKMGYSPVISSAHRDHGTAGTGHTAGAAVDVGLYTADGKLLGNDEEEYRVTTEAARRAGFSTALNELKPYSSKYWSGPHVHLSMHDEGEALHNHALPTEAARQDLKYSRRNPGGLRGTARSIAMSVGLDPDLYEAQIDAESGFQTHGPDGGLITSSVGAQGLSQMMPETRDYVLKKYGMSLEDFNRNPATQLRAGALYMKEKVDEWDGDYAAAIASYNAGSGGLATMRKNKSGYPETVNYYKRILSTVAGRDVSYTEAENHILYGGGPKHDRSIYQRGYEQDEARATSFVSDFLSNIKQNAASDAWQGTQEFLSGVTFGLSEFVPGLKPGNKWDNIRTFGDTSQNYADKALGLGVEIPWFLGSILAGEALTAGYAAKWGKGMDAAKAGFSGVIGGEIGPMSTPMGSLGRSLFEKSYTNLVASNGGKVGVLGRMMFGKPASFFDNIAAHGLAFGTQAALEGTTRRVKEGATWDQLVVKGLGDFIIGGSAGLLMGLGIPVIGGAGANIGINAAKAGREFAPDLAAKAGESMGGFVVRQGVKAATRGVIGGSVGGMMGAAGAELQGEDPFEGAATGAKIGALGSLVGPEVFTAVMRKVSPETSKRVYDGIEKVYQKMDDAQKHILSTTVMERVLVAKRAGDEALMETKAVKWKENLQKNIANVETDKQALQKQADTILAREQEMKKTVTMAREQLRVMETVDQGVAANKDTYLELEDARQLLTEEYKQLKKQRFGAQNDPELQKKLDSTAAQLEKATKEIESITKANPGMTSWISARKALRGHEDKLAQLQSLDTYRMATSVIPEQIKGLSRMQEDSQKKLDWLNNPDQKEIFPVGDAPWDLADNVDPRFRQTVLNYFKDRTAEYARQVSRGTPSAEVVERWQRLASQTFNDPKGDFERQLSKIQAHLNDQIKSTELRKKSTSPVISASKKMREKYFEESGIKWSTGHAGKGKQKSFVRASVLLEYMERNSPMTSNWQVPPEVLDKMRKGDKLALPEVYRLSDGSLGVKNIDHLRAAVAIGQEYVPVRLVGQDKKAMGKALKAFARESDDLRIADMKSQVEDIQRLQDRYYGELRSHGVMTEQEGLNVVPGNPYRIDYDKFHEDLEAAYRTDKQFRQFGSKELDEDEAALLVEEAHNEFLKLPPDELALMAKARFQELATMFDSAEGSSTSLRQLVVERALARNNADSNTVTDTFLDNVGAPLVDMEQSLHYNVEGKMKASASGVLKNSEVLGHTLSDYTEMSGDQLMVNEYANRLEDKFLQDLDEGVVALQQALSPEASTPNRGALKFFETFLGKQFKKASDLTSEDIGSAIAYALDSDADMGKLLKEVPELTPTVRTYLKSQKQWEDVIAKSPDLKGYMRTSYLMHKYQDMEAFYRAHAGDSDFSNRITRLMTENKRSFSTLREAREAFVKAENRIKAKRLGVNEFMALPLDSKIAKAYGLSQAEVRAMGKEAYDKAAGDMEGLVHDLLVGRPVTNPARLMREKIKMTVRADSLRRFLGGLSDFETEIPGGGGARAQLLVQGHPDAAKASAPNGYKRVADIPGWNSVELENAVGDKVGAHQLWVHPEVDRFLREYAHASGKASEQNWNTVLGLIRTSTLFGTPVPHFLNVLSNNLAEFSLSPAKALGMISAGKRIAQDGINGTSGDFLQLYAIKAGVNMNTMRTTTRLIAQDINKFFEGEGLFGTQPQGKVGNFIEAMDPMNPARREAARARLGRVGRGLSTVMGALPEADYVVNRKMLFDVIEQSQVAGFFFRTGSYLEELRQNPEFEKLPKRQQLAEAQKLAADRVNETAGAIPYMYSTDKTRRFVYSTLLTPSWFLAKARAFVSALDSSLGLLGDNVSKSPVLNRVAPGLAEKAGGLGENTVWSTLAGKPVTRFGHLPPETRKLYATKLTKTVATGLAAYIGGVQVASYLINGHTTFENPDPDKWLHLRVGGHYYTNPMFGFFRDVAKNLTGSAVAGDAVEMWSNSLWKQFIPGLRSLPDIAKNRDGFTGTPIARPGAGALEGGAALGSYILKESVNAEDLLGISSVENIPQMLKSLNPKGDPINRLTGREWALRQLGIWETDYNAPARLAGDANAVMGWYKNQLETEVLANLEAAYQAKDPERANRYLQRAYTLGLREGVEVKDKRLSRYLPEGRLRLTGTRLRNMIAKLRNPSGYAIVGQGKPDSPPVFQYLMNQLQKEKEQEEKEGYAYLIHQQSRRM